MEDNYSKLYRAMVNSGYDAADLGGNEEEFRSAMQDSTMRKNFYDWASKNEKNGFRIGSYESYEARLAPAAKPSPAPLTPAAEEPRKEKAYTQVPALKAALEYDPMKNIEDKVKKAKEKVETPVPTKPRPVQPRKPIVKGMDTAIRGAKVGFLNGKADGPKVYVEPDKINEYLTVAPYAERGAYNEEMARAIKEGRVMSPEEMAEVDREVEEAAKSPEGVARMVDAAKEYNSFDAATLRANSKIRGQIVEDDAAALVSGLYDAYAKERKARQEQVEKDVESYNSAREWDLNPYAEGTEALSEAMYRSNATTVRDADELGMIAEFAEDAKAKIMSDKDMRAKAEENAALLDMPLDKYVNEIAVPVLQSKMYGAWLAPQEGRMRKNYNGIMAAVENSLFGTLFGFTRTDTERYLSQVGQEEWNKNASLWGKAAAGAGGMLLDLPAFIGLGSLAAVPTKAVGSQVFKQLAKNETKRLVARGVAETAAKRYANIAVRNGLKNRILMGLATAPLQGGLTFGMFDAGKTALNMSLNGEWDWSELGKSAAGGTLLGGALGVVGATGGALTHGLRGGTKVAAKVAEFGVENAVFTEGGRLIGKLHGQQPENGWLEDYVESGATLLMLKAPNIVKNVSRIKGDKEASEVFAFNRLEREQLAKYGKDLNAVLEEMLPKGEKMAVEGEKVSLDGVNEGVLTEQYVAAMNNPEIPLVTKAKLMAVVEGKVMPAPRVVDAQIEGNRVMTYDPMGRLVETKEYATEAKAKTEYEKVADKAEVESIAVLEDMYVRLKGYEADDATVKEWFAKNPDVKAEDVARIVAKDNVDEPLTKAEQKILDSLRKARREGLNDISRLQSLDLTKYDIQEKDLLAGLAKPANERTDAENKAVNAYREALTNEVQHIFNARKLVTEAEIREQRIRTAEDVERAAESVRRPQDGVKMLAGRMVESDARIDETANDGMVYTTTNNNGEKIIITGGKVVLDNEGFIDVNQSEGLVALMPDGTKKPVRVDELREKVEVSNAEELKAAKREEIKQEVAAENGWKVLEPGADIEIAFDGDVYKLKVQGRDERGDVILSGEGESMAVPESLVQEGMKEAERLRNAEVASPTAEEAATIEGGEAKAEGSSPVEAPVESTVPTAEEVADAQAFADAYAANTMEAYQNYLDKFPEGAYRESARRGIWALEGTSSVVDIASITNAENVLQRAAANEVQPEVAPVVEGQKGENAEKVVEPVGESKPKVRGRRQVEKAVERMRKADAEGNALEVLNNIQTAELNAKRGDEGAITPEEQAELDALKKKYAEMGYEVVDPTGMEYDVEIGNLAESEQAKIGQKYILGDTDFQVHNEGDKLVVKSVVKPAIIKDGVIVQKAKVLIGPEGTDNGNFANMEKTRTEDSVSVDNQGNPIAQAPKTALEQIPRNENNIPLYEQVDSELAWDGVVEEAGGNEETAMVAVNSMVEDKKKALAAAEKAKAKAGATITEKIAAENERVANIERAKADLAKWEEIAGVKAKRALAAEAESKRVADEAAAKQRAEEERLRAEREEAERAEREALNGVPDMVDDKPQDARARGYRRVNGHKVDRQEPVQGLMGKEIAVKFSDSSIPTGRVAVIEAEQLQPSHIQGQRNPLHFIDEAQPKERNDAASVLSARKIAENVRPEEITSSVTAYTGAPTVNTRGEAVQGNNRSAALRLMWENNPEQAAKYKQYLMDHAAEFGLNAEDVAAMKSPVLVNMLDVSDADAITLGQYVAQDTESGGTERIKPKNVMQKMGGDMRSFANKLLASNNEEASFAELVDANGVEVLKWMAQKGYITPTQYKSAFDSKGNLTAEVKNDLRDVMYQSIFKGGSTQLEEMFNALPAKAQKAILATAFRDYDSPSAERMNGEVQNSIRAYYALARDAAFANAKNYKEAKEAAMMWARQYQLDDVSGESFLPSENFSNFAIELAVKFKGETQKILQNLFNNIYDLIQGTKQASLFEEADNTPRTLKEAIKETFNIDYNGQYDSNSLAIDSKDGQARKRGGNGDIATGERIEGGERPADSTGGARGNGEVKPTLSQTGDQVSEQEKQSTQSVGEQVQAAEAEVNTTPTDAQKEAGNYKKGHVKIGPFNISIEQPKGSVRSGVDKGGKKWEVEMQNTYGYIRGTEGVDGDHIDVFLSDDIDGWDGHKVFVVDQRNADGSFDEHKVMLGFNDINDAEAAYMSNYEEGWQGLGAITGVSIEEFEKWIASSHRKTKAFAEYKNVKTDEGQSAPGKSGVAEPQAKIAPKKRIPTTLQEIGEVAVERSEEKQEEKRRVPLRARTQEWAEKLGVPVKVHESIETVTNREAKRRLENDDDIDGWFNVADGSVEIYLPNVNDVAQVDNVYLHEVVGHKGLREVMGEKFDTLCDNVWGTMSESKREHFLDYIGAVDEFGVVLESPSQKQMRDAADEYMAWLAENVDYETNKELWQPLIDSVREFFESLGMGAAEGEKGVSPFVMSDADIVDLIKASYANLASKASVSSITEAAEQDKQNVEQQVMFSKTSRRIEDLFDKAVAGDLTGKAVTVGKLTKAGKEYLETISGLTLKGDVDFVLNPSDLLHIYNNHYGENEKDKGNNIPLNRYDIRRMVDVIAFPTKIVYGEGKNGRKSFYFLMDTPGGAYNLLEIYADKKGNLSSKTYYKTKKGVSQRVMNILNSLHSTSVADGATLSNAKVPQMFEKTNTESENSSEQQANPQDSESGIRFRKGNPTLLGTHSITEDKLRKAIKMGGLANPSTAVFELGEEIPGEYGEITFVMPSSMVDKKTGRNTGAFAGDAWTPTYPQVERQMGKRGSARAREDVQSVPKEMQKEGVMEGQTMFRFIGKKGADNLDKAEVAPGQDIPLDEVESKPISRIDLSNGPVKGVNEPEWKFKARREKWRRWVESNTDVKTPMPEKPFLQEGESIEEYATRMKEFNKELNKWKKDILSNESEIEKMMDILYDGKIPEMSPTPEDEFTEQVFKRYMGDDGIKVDRKSMRGMIMDEIIERRRKIETNNFDDVVFIDKVRKATTAEQRKAIPFIIEGTYNGKLSPELASVVNRIRDWFENVYQALQAADAMHSSGKISNYVTHIWDKARTPKAVYENYINTRSKYTNRRSIETYAEGIALGMVPKYDDICDIMLEYGHIANEAIANKDFIDFLHMLRVDGEPVLKDAAIRDPMYVRISVGALDEYKVHRYAKNVVETVLGNVRTENAGPILRGLAHFYDMTGSLMKKINLSLSFFHHGALIETAVGAMGPAKTISTTLKNLVWDCMRSGELPALSNPEAARNAVNHLVQLGATQDYMAKEVNRLTGQLKGMLQDFSDKHPNFATKSIVKPAELLDFLNTGFDKVLWDYLHDGLKIYTFDKYAKEIEEYCKKKGVDDTTKDMLLNEAGQFVNDTFGGQFWELIHWSPATVKWMRRLLLSPDWTTSTIRQALSPLGFGTLYKDYEKNWFKRTFSGIPEAVTQRRKMGAKFWIIAMLTFVPLMNALNAWRRKDDVDEELRKAEERRKTDPEYKSPYELKYPEGMKWYDYTMYGNTIGHQTHLFGWRYDDGKEGYIRWGKQFRELPELFLGKDGFSFPGPMIDKMVGKMNPALSASLAFLGYAKDGWQSKWMKDKKGWEKELGRVMMMASAFMPYSIPTDEDKEFMLTDLMMPSSKGFSNNKAIREFETAILAQDFDYVGKVYDACAMNKLDAEKLLRAAIARVETQAKAEYVEGANTLEEAWAKYQEDLDVNEKRAVRAKFNRLLQENAYKDFEKQEARDMVQSVLDGTYREEKLPDAYIASETAEDVRDAYKMDSIRLRLKKVVDDIPEDAVAYKLYYEDNRTKIDLYYEVVAARREINLIMEDIKIYPQQTELFMQEIRDIRKEVIELANNLTSNNE